MKQLASFKVAGIGDGRTLPPLECRGRQLGSPSRSGSPDSGRFGATTAAAADGCARATAKQRPAKGSTRSISPHGGAAPSSPSAAKESHMLNIGSYHRGGGNTAGASPMLGQY